MSRPIRISVSGAPTPEGRYEVISASDAERRFGLYQEQINALVEAGLVHDVGSKPGDPRKSKRGHTKYPDWELARAAQDLAGGLTIVQLLNGGSNGAREHKTISILRCEPRRLAA